LCMRVFFVWALVCELVCVLVCVLVYALVCMLICAAQAKPPSADRARARKKRWAKKIPSPKTGHGIPNA
jgi:hypothetical protein